MTDKTNISRRAALTLGIASLATIASRTSDAQSINARPDQPIVVELFTSQGCSSCPPADKILGELAKQKNIIPLSLNVDYWDYLGWRDTLGSPEHTKRQKQYAANRGSQQIYTPQMIINGHIDVVGSRRNQVMSALKQALSKTPRVPIEITQNASEIIIDVGQNKNIPQNQKATVWVIMALQEVFVPIKRGENSGKQITYHNVVRQMIPVGMWEGKPLKLKLPKASLDLRKNKSSKSDCIVLLQKGTVGEIIGVARAEDLSI